MSSTKQGDGNNESVSSFGVVEAPLQSVPKHRRSREGLTMEFIGDGSTSEDSETELNAGEDVAALEEVALTDSNSGAHKRKATSSDNAGASIPQGQQAKRLKESNDKEIVKETVDLPTTSLSTNHSSSSSQSISNFQPSRNKYSSIENIYHADKSILSFDVDRSGTLMIAGGHNCKVEQFELNKLQGTNEKNSLSPVREVTPEPGTAVWSVKYNNNCTKFAVACVSPTSIYDRVCRKVVSFVRGDPYLADMSKTKGHISVVTGISWHPRDREVLLTSSLDGSIRTWNLNGTKHFDALVCNQVVKARDENGRRIGITSSCYDCISGNLVAGVTSRGGLQIWKLKAGTKLDRPQFCNNQANVGCGDMSDVTFVGDGRHLLTRVNSDDGKASSSFIKLWDTRNIGKPLKSIKCLKSNENKCTFHLIENTTYLVCPTDTGKDERAEVVNVYNMANRGSNASSTIELESSCICAMYNKKLDTLFTGECDGTISRVKGFAHF